jgi:hypothetical protein
MTRKKKLRKVGTEGPAVYSEKKTSELELDGRERQKVRKRKGLKAGHRNVEGQDKKSQSQKAPRDPRLGSKKPIVLVVNTKKPTKAQRRVNAEQELAQLENDPQLMALLDRLDDGEKLGAGLQKNVDEKLDRIEQLMKQLGLLDPIAEDDVIEESVETVVYDNESDEDKLQRFENFKEGDWS